MLENILPTSIYEILEKHLNYSKIYELRLRLDKPIVVNYSSKFYYLSLEGLTNLEENAIIGTKHLIDSIVLKASNYSIYSINEDIKRGYITLNNGIRIGLAGEVVSENELVKTIKDFNGLNIRIPHEIKNCSLNILNYIVDNGQVFNTLIISSPCGGKTTFIRDICYQISNKNYPLNLLLLDERNEISATYKGKNTMNIGKFTDVIVYGNKKLGFENGIRSMSPNVIITDEIANKEDVDAINYAVNCGVSIVATTHAKDLEDIKAKKLFADVLYKKIFKRYIVLSQKNGAGTIEGVFDENLIRLL
ncbi:MAG: stage III sporulation protein AA [Clostridiales bacterium]|nr:stage III sporulation protein AA [Clostridiales bacterium]